MASGRRLESIRVFRSPLLEACTHVHPLVPLALWGPLVAWLLYRTLAVHHLGIPAAAAVGGLGLLAWTLTEYGLHRFLFHLEPGGPRRARLQFMLHGLHHADPLDPTRLVMPPVPAVIGGVALYGLFRLLLGRTWVDPFYASFVLGYLIYDYIHFGVHRFAPRTRIGQSLQRNHMRHHYLTPDARWGVSSPLWDYVFGTIEGLEPAREARVADTERPRRPPGETR